MRKRARLCVLVLLLGVAAGHAAEVRARLKAAAPAGKSQEFPPAVLWLQPVQPLPARALLPGHFTLMQKNKTFVPHLLVVPVGSSVSFPNADPFFHNVFSLFNGRRFDLGLYEAGSTRSVLFSREGVSYIFCNIHSEMSAVVLALTTPFYSVADAHGEFRVRDVPEGDYDLTVWIEGRKQDTPERSARRIHISAEGVVDAGAIPIGQREEGQHLNKFGKPYEPGSGSVY